MHPMESLSYNGTQVLTSDAREFSDCIQKLVVLDHAYNGPLFTWSNRQGDGYIAKKLDRALINAQWLFSFLSSRMEFLSLGVSDHYLVIIQLSSTISSSPKPFKFFNFWTRHPEFL